MRLVGMASPPAPVAVVLAERIRLAALLGLAAILRPPFLNRNADVRGQRGVRANRAGRDPLAKFGGLGGAIKRLSLGRRALGGATLRHHPQLMRKVDCGLDIIPFAAREAGVRAFERGVRVGIAHDNGVVGGAAGLGLRVEILGRMQQVTAPRAAGGKEGLVPGPSNFGVGVVGHVAYLGQKRSVHHGSVCRESDTLPKGGAATDRIFTARRATLARCAAGSDSKMLAAGSRRFRYLPFILPGPRNGMLRR